MVESIDKEFFQANVFDFENNEEWEFEGELPAIVDFYADWCMPCKIVAPILEDLAEKYEGRLDFYKVDIEEHSDLAQIFGARSIPSLLFIPLEGRPMMRTGTLPLKSFEDIIKSKLL